MPPRPGRGTSLTRYRGQPVCRSLFTQLPSVPELTALAQARAGRTIATAHQRYWDAARGR